MISMVAPLPGQLPYSGIPAPPPPPSPPQRRRPWLTATALIAAALLIAAAAAIGRITAPQQAITPTPVAAPTNTSAPPPADSLRPFDSADETWCKTYQATSDQAAVAGNASGAPRSLAAPDVPATAWPPAAAAANQRFADYLVEWTPGPTDLRVTDAHPILKTLFEASIADSAALASVIHDRTYLPTDLKYLRSFGAIDRALLAICKELVG